MKTNLKSVAAAALAVVCTVPALAQSDTTSTTSTSSQSTWVPGTSRSEGGAIISILSRLNAEQGQAVLRTLDALENKAASMPGRNTGFVNTQRMILEAVPTADEAAFRSAWTGMSSFDKESLAILARDAYFAGLTDGEGGQSRPLRFATEATSTTPYWVPTAATVRPEWRILDSLSGKLSDQNGQILRTALERIDMRGQNERNLGFQNAQTLLLNTIGGADRDAFVQGWKGLDYSDREAILTLVRDAALGGINDQ